MYTGFVRVLGFVLGCQLRRAGRGQGGAGVHQVRVAHLLRAHHPDAAAADAPGALPCRAWLMYGWAVDSSLMMLLTASTPAQPNVQMLLPLTLQAHHPARSWLRGSVLVEQGAGHALLAQLAFCATLVRLCGDKRAAALNRATFCASISDQRRRVNAEEAERWTSQGRAAVSEGGSLRLGARLSVCPGWGGTFCVVRVQSVAGVAKLTCADGVLRQGEICDIDGKCVDAAEDEVFKLTTQSGKLAVEVEKVCVRLLLHYQS